MTHDHTPDASARTCRESLRLWLRAQIAMGHPARLVHDVLEAEADQIRQLRTEQEADR